MANPNDRMLIRNSVSSPTVWARRSAAVALFAALTASSACKSMRLQSPIAPVAGPPPTFVQSTSDVRSTRLLEVKDGVTKTAAFKAATDLLTQNFSVDVSDQHAGFLMTPWQATFVRDGAPDLRYRTRVMIRFLGDDWKQVSVRSQANWQREGTVDEWIVGYDTKILDDVANDLSGRIGKKP